MANPTRPWAELSSSGLLWLINRVVFHPRGFALGASADGWMLLGDGTEPWAFGIAFDEDALFAAAAATLATAKGATDG